MVGQVFETRNTKHAKHMAEQSGIVLLQGKTGTSRIRDCVPRRRSHSAHSLCCITSHGRKMNAARSARPRTVINAAVARLATNSRGRKIVRDPRKAKVLLSAENN